MITITEIRLSNSELNVRVNTLGAELTSILHQEKEYIWQADKEKWGRHAPNLFPIVGKLKEDHFVYNGNEYPMTQHGFARDMEFSIVEYAADKAILRLSQTKETLANYPFMFVFDVIYTLDRNALRVDYRVVNPSDSQELLFSVGAHPGFNIPNDSDNLLVITSEEPMERIPIDSVEVLTRYSDKYSENDPNKSTYSLNEELFSEGVLIFCTTSKTEIQLVHRNERILKVSYDQMPYLGIWSTYPEQSNFVCIEPWCGIADDSDSTGLLTEKRGINRLSPNNEWFYNIWCCYSF